MGPKRLIAVVRVADEGVVVGMKAHVEAQVELIAEKRAGEDASERGELWSARLNREHAALVVALVAGEEEGPILANRSAELIAELLPLEERVRIAGITPQAGISGQVVVAIKVESAAVKVVAAGARHDIDRAVAGQAGREIEVDGRDLELLHDLLGHLQSRAESRRRQ